MISWIKGLGPRLWAWVATGLSLAIAVAAALFYRRRAVVSDAQKANEQARTRVATLEAERSKNVAIVGENDKYVKKIDQAILEVKRGAVMKPAETEKLTDEEVSKRFRDLGF